MGLILKHDRLVHTVRGRLHEPFLGSSSYFYNGDEHRLMLKKDYRSYRDHLNRQAAEFDSFRLSHDNSADQSWDSPRLAFWGKTQASESFDLFEKDVEKDLKRESRSKKTEYKLNKDKVRSKCCAMFSLKESRKFLAFYTFSFPQNMPDDSIMKCYNTFLTRLRKTFKFSTYLWVAERQKNQTLHFHLLTNRWMPIRQVNRYLGVAINNELKRNSSLSSLNFNLEKYNGVDVKRCDNNRKQLYLYLTKYISKNDITFDRLPFHCSRDVSMLFTALSYSSVKDPRFQRVAKVLENVMTLVVDSKWCTLEYFSIKQENGKFFTPPDSFYLDIECLNNLIYNNFHSPYPFRTISLTQSN